MPQPFTADQTKIAFGLAAGLKTAKIAENLGKSYSCVNVQMTRMRTRVGLWSTRALREYCRQHYGSLQMDPDAEAKAARRAELKLDPGWPLYFDLESDAWQPMSQGMLDELLARVRDLKIAESAGPGA